MNKREKIKIKIKIIVSDDELRREGCSVQEQLVEFFFFFCAKWLSLSFSFVWKSKCNIYFWF
jgi:hypothetical protein